MEARKLIIALAIKHNGEWLSIYRDIQDKVMPTEEELAKAEGIECITILDDDYPTALKQGFKPPFVLFCKGNKQLLNDTDILAVVGSRNPTGRTITFTEKFVSSRNETIITGMNIGINSKVAHTALENGNNTILVLAEGIDNKATFPELYDKVAEKGLIISEYPFNTPAQKENFAFRYRLISGLCKAVCIMDIKQHSGTNVLVMNAINSGKEIYVKPDIESKDSYENQLIDEGANCLTLATTI